MTATLTKCPSGFEGSIIQCFSSMQWTVLIWVQGSHTFIFNAVTLTFDLMNNTNWSYESKFESNMMIAFNWIVRKENFQFSNHDPNKSSSCILYTQWPKQDFNEVEVSIIPS